MTQAQELQIDFGRMLGAPEQPPSGAADTALARLVSSGKPRTLVCQRLLNPTQRDQAKTVAAQLLPAMLSNTDQLATFGNNAMEQVNGQVNRIFHEIGPVDIPELTNIMQDINDRMREFRH